MKCIELCMTYLIKKVRKISRIFLLLYIYILRCKIRINKYVHTYTIKSDTHEMLSIEKFLYDNLISFRLFLLFTIRIRLSSFRYDRVVTKPVGTWCTWVVYISRLFETWPFFHIRPNKNQIVVYRKYANIFFFVKVSSIIPITFNFFVFTEI